MMRAHSVPSPEASWETRVLGAITATLVVFGVAAVYSSSSIIAVQAGDPGTAFAWRQVLGALLGGVLFMVGGRLDYHAWERIAWPLLAAVTVCLVVLLLPFAGGIVLELNNARRWIGLGGLSFQPAEVAKFAAIVWTAALATKKGSRIREFKKGLLPFIVVLGPVAMLILFEPALSTTLLLVLICGTVLFAAGAKIGHFLILAVALLPVLWGEIVTTQYRLQRMLTFLSPGGEADASWQIQQSLTGMGSGRLLGTGFGEGMQKLGYLPYAYSDFIFSTIGEEWGFLGVTVLVALFAGFIFIGLRIARTAPDRFGTLLSVGITAMIGITAILHMAVTLGVVPTTGLPLPFISYGRSNLLVSMLAAGVLINIGEARTGPRRSRA